MNTNDPWDVLGVPRSSSIEEIKKAYRRKALSCHPDRGGSAEDMKRATWAFESLQQYYSANPSRPKESTASVNRGNTASEPERWDAPEVERYAEAYSNAWFNVPDRVRFWVSFAEALHNVSLVVAWFAGIGSALMILGGIVSGRGEQFAIGVVILGICSACFYLVKIEYWENLKFNLADRYAREQASKSFAQKSDQKRGSSSDPSVDPTASLAREWVSIVVCIGLILFACAVPAMTGSSEGVVFFIMIVGAVMVFKLKSIFSK